MSTRALGARSTGSVTSSGSRWSSRPPQGWAVVAAWASLACAVPSALWRLLAITGALPGTAAFRAAHDGDLAYVVGLSTVQLLVGVLTVGLVRPWGERLLGVRVPRWFPVVVGTLGGLALVWLFTWSLPWALAHGSRPDENTMSGGPLALMVACYAPVLLWGPLELVAVAGYALRRR